MNLLDELAIKFNKSKDEIRTYSLKAPDKYKMYLIPKRKKGKRLIAQPTSELKSIQRYIVFHKLQKLPIHPCTYAYRKNISIKDNASVHVKNSYLLNLDLENFFNSITPRLFWKVWARTLKNLPDKEEQELYENFLFWRPRKSSHKMILSIGAPSSPYISNFILYELDSFLSTYCDEKLINYSRYADDLTFSTNKRNILFDIRDIVEGKIFELYNGLISLNDDKTTYSSKARNRHVTGLVLANDDKISIGRRKKRFIKSLIFKSINNELSLESISYLSGYLSYIKDVEPSFIFSLERKYSYEVIHKIMGSKNEN